MNVEGLIEKLKEFPPKTRVIVAGYEGGYDDIDTIMPIPIRLKANKEWYFGAHKESTSKKAKKAVALLGGERMKK